MFLLLFSAAFSIFNPKKPEHLALTKCPRQGANFLGGLQRGAPLGL
jgi:hypothetical protein